jgi:hypothetical protein
MASEKQDLKDEKESLLKRYAHMELLLKDNNIRSSDDAETRVSHRNSQLI